MATAPRLFDVVCIGAYACKAGKEVTRLHKASSPSICYLNQQNEIFEPSLMSYSQNPFLQIKSTNYQNGPYFTDKVVQIDPQRQLVVMETGEKIKYKQLIYSDSAQNWKNKDYYPNLAKAIATPYTSVYGDHHCKNIKEMFQRCLGNIKIVIPKERHFGYENYFMLKLKNDILKHAKKQQIKANFKLEILLEGSSFFPYDPMHDSTIKKLLDQAQIPFYTNCQIENINYNRRYAYINGTRHSYKALYQYLPFTTPQLLKQADIDPLKTNPLTLRHGNYNNINILGNVLPVTHSFHALSYQTNVIAKNVINALNNAKKVSIYNGDTIIPIWQSSDKVMLLSSNYQKNKNLMNSLGTNNIASRCLANAFKLAGKMQIQKFLNGNSKGFPYYFRFPYLHTVSADESLVPVLLKKEKLSKQLV